MSLETCIVACSGPGAAQTIAQNIALGYFSAFVTGLAAAYLFWLRPRPFWNGSAYACLLLFALHPAWTISARKGDCGRIQMMASVAVFSVTMGLLAPEALSRLRKSKRERQGASPDNDNAPH
ncbi:hypothetical protein OKA04_12955 [Luteolibacter flavescens]|uniref:Uncharacterized protein n=1 Tax=Luteolibacter flavescens TaxID=1859460 RepID=A0ABT3FPY2_9BACT|nr:hypothetical protein [Luteolibacter flavescens]MCW1885641.1 hypothetical protein [Luteolibacter flavescens]